MSIEPVAISTAAGCLPFVIGLVGCEVGATAGMAFAGRVEYAMVGGMMGFGFGAALAAITICHDLDE